MRNAPQRITDQRTGRRVIVPRRSHQRQKSTTGKYPQDEQQLGWANPLLWGLCRPLAAVAAIILIGLHQLRLQQHLSEAESALAAHKPPPITAPDQTHLIARLGTTPPLTAWLTSASQPMAPIGTLLIDGQQGLLLIQNLRPA